MAKVTGGELVVRTLLEAGVDTLFGLHGAHIDAIFQACLDHRLPIIDTRHEAAAGHAAEGVATAGGADRAGRSGCTELGRLQPVALGIQADARATLDALTHAATGRVWPDLKDWRDTVLDLVRARHERVAADCTKEAHLHPFQASQVE